MSEKLFKRYWYNPSSAGYLSTPNSFYKFLTTKGHAVSREEVHRFVVRQPTYQKTKEVKKRRDTVPMLVTAPHLSQQCDLAFFATKNTTNKKVVLVCVDTFSSKIFAHAMQQKKTAKAVWSAYEKLLKKMEQPPVVLSTDAGTEFVNSHFIGEAKKRGIKMRALRTYQKAAVAENAIHRIKQQWRRLRVQTGSRDLRNHLPKIVARLNARPNSVTGIAPDDVTLKNAGIVFKRRYGEYFEKLYANAHKPTPFNMGDRVRIVNRFTAGDVQIGAQPIQKFSDEIYTVRRVRRTFPPTYEIVDDKLRLPGRFYYDHQLVLVTENAD